MKVKKNTVLKVIAMYSATGLSSVIGLLTSILNTNILGTAGFGDLKFIETVVRFVTSLTTAGYFISITRLLAISSDKEYQRKLLGYFVVLLIVMGIIGSTLVIAFSYIEPIYFKNDLGPTIRVYFFIMAIFLTSTALLDILRGLNYIYTIAFLSIASGALYLAIAYPLSIYTTMSLDTVLFLSYGITFIFSLSVILILKPNFKFGKGTVKRVQVENRYNGRPIYYGSLAGVATGHIAGFSISYFLDNTQLGFYMLALTICSPLLMIPSVLGTIFFKSFANINKIPRKIFLFSVGISIAVLLVFQFIIEDVIVYFYSPEFLESAMIAKILIIAFLFHGLGDLFNRFLGAKGKGKLLRNTAFIVGAVNVLGYTVLAYFFGMDGVIFTRILSSISYFILMLAFYFNYVKKSEPTSVQV